MLFEEHFLYRAGDEGYHECRIPALLTTDRGTVLAFNEARKFTGRDSDQIDLFLRRSFDECRTWTVARELVRRARVLLRPLRRPGRHHLLPV